MAIIILTSVGVIANSDEAFWEAIRVLGAELD
jgi:hypothetical protein